MRGRDVGNGSSVYGKSRSDYWHSEGVVPGKWAYRRVGRSVPHRSHMSEKSPTRGLDAVAGVSVARIHGALFVIIAVEWLPDGEIGCCRGALLLVLARDHANLPRVVARYATQALPRYTGEPKTKP